MLPGSAKTVVTEGSLGGDRAISSGRASTLPRHRDYPPPASGLTGLSRWLNRPSASAIAWLGDLTFRRGVNRARRELGHTPLRLKWDELPIVLAWSPTLVPASTDWTHPDRPSPGSGGCRPIPTGNRGRI